MTRKAKLAVFKFASCDGCQLALLDAEDDILRLAEMVDIAYFLEVTSRIDAGPFDVALVEGSITTPHDAERIRDVRAQSKYLITIGACATSGGIQALRNGADHDEFLRYVYPSPEYLRTLAQSTAIADHVSVDFELRGCPINHLQLLEVLAALLAGRRPRTPAHSVCLDCKRKNIVCVVVAAGTPCLGPVTQSGCGALCPSYDRGCYGCFGPAQQANAASLTHQFRILGCRDETVVHLLQNVNAAAPAFREAAQQLTTTENGNHGPL